MSATLEFRLWHVGVRLVVASTGSVHARSARSKNRRAAATDGETDVKAAGRRACLYRAADQYG
jgi:hypothetical protein